MQFRKNVHKGILKQIFRIHFIIQHPQAYIMHSLGIKLIQLLLCKSISRQAALYNITMYIFIFHVWVASSLSLPMSNLDYSDSKYKKGLRE